MATSNCDTSTTSSYLMSAWPCYLRQKEKKPSAVASKLLCARSAICLLSSRVKAFHSLYFCQSRDSGSFLINTSATHTQKRDSKDLGGAITWKWSEWNRGLKQEHVEGCRTGWEAVYHCAVSSTPSCTMLLQQRTDGFIYIRTCVNWLCSSLSMG